MKKPILIVIIVTVVIILNNSILDKPIQNFTNRLIAKPNTWLAVQSRTVSSLKQKFADSAKLAAESQELKKIIAELTGKLANYDALERENRFLRRQLDVNPNYAGRVLAARVLDVRKNPLASTILIGRGSADSISSGMTVIAAGNVFVGTVLEVYEKSSLILLADDPRQNLSVRIRGTNTLGRTEGALGSTFRINLIDHSEEIAAGSDVVSAGLGSVPEALVVGRVNFVEEVRDRRLFKNISAQTLFDLSLSSDVFVIIR